VGFVEQAASRSRTSSMARSRGPPDPYAHMRGFSMSRWENYVYGAPAMTVAEGNPMPPADEPPCCTVCNKAADQLHPTLESGCCVVCIWEIPEMKPYLNRRQR